MTSKTVNHVLIDFCQRSPEVEHLKDPPTKDLANSSLLISVCLQAMLELDETDADDGNGDNPEGDLSP